MATNNQFKIEEIRSLLGSYWQLLSLEEVGCVEELPETRHTLEDNALQKASYVFENYGVPCFADDSGLEAEALNGEPGVYSARYAGEQRNADDNMALLLSRLAGLENRSARFRCVIALVGPNESKLFEGRVDGVILTEKRGTKGFGYDPIFKPLGFTKTFAEMTPEEKNAISHRAIAVGKLVNYLAADLRS